MKKSKMNKSRNVMKEFRKAKAPLDKEDWIADQLRKVYDETVKEDIPQDMLALLDDLDQSEKARFIGDDEDATAAGDNEPPEDCK